MTRPANGTTTGGASQSKARLLHRSAEGSQATIGIGDRPLTLGRRTGNDVQILRSSVSREHARIFVHEGTYWVEDLGSKHGTFVNGRRVDRFALSHNDHIRLGTAVDDLLVFQVGSEVEGIMTSSGDVSVDEPAHSQENLASLLQLTRALNSTLQLDQVLERVIDAVIALTGAERVLILLGEDAANLEIRASYNHPDAARSKLAFSRTVVEQVFAHGKPRIVRNIEQDDRLKSQQSIQSLRLGSVMCAPLRLTQLSYPDTTPRPGVPDNGDRIIGVIYVDRRAPIQHFGHQDLAFFEALASHAAIAIENARLYKEARAMYHLEQELTVARRIQEGLLRARFPALPWLQVHARNLPSRGVAGDYYEVLTTPEGCVIFAIGDVSGKGVPAALLMATLQSSFLAAAVSEDDLGNVCAHVNRFLAERTPSEQFATFFAGRIQPLDDGTFGLEYVNAGHNPPYVVGSDQHERLHGGGYPLGFFADAEYGTLRARLRPEDVVVCYTDGVVEAMDPDGNEFGHERLLEAVVSSPGSTAEDLAERMYRAVETHVAGGSGLFDDVTLVVLRLLAQRR